MRGASPIQSAIDSGETCTGVSLMRIEPSMDTGAVCDVQKVEIHINDTADIVFENQHKHLSLCRGIFRSYWKNQFTLRLKIMIRQVIVAN